ncbi:electron transfer flavoprotein alpha subunit [Komagataeibacter xylinus E25]|nr:electron transfer flavoprotein alpha subunit [Komagataeibacter xylinus E25]
MAVLVYLDHEGGAIRQASRSAIAAASRLGDVDVLVTGPDAAAAAKSAAAIPGVKKVLQATDTTGNSELAEPVAALLAELAAGYTHILAASSATAKNVLPRAAALLDVQPIPDIVAINDADTFVRPIYAGSALATVKSADAKKIITVRASSFDPVASEGGNATIEDVALPAGSGGSTFIATELSKSERPELESARVVVSGGNGMLNGEKLQAAGTAGRPPGRRHRRIARGSGQGLRFQRIPGGPDRQDRGAGTVYRHGDFGPDPASGRDEGQQGHRRGQQGP